MLEIRKEGSHAPNWLNGQGQHDTKRNTTMSQHEGLSTSSLIIYFLIPTRSTNTRGGLEDERRRQDDTQRYM